jgi:hypothetical protein
VTMERYKTLFTPPSAEEITRRKALVTRILAKRQERNITPLTSAELVRKARNWETPASQ